MIIKTCLELLENNQALRRGELVLGEKFITEEVKKRLDTTLIKSVDISFIRQHCIVDLKVGKAGLNYRWISSFILRSIDLNKSNRHVLFEQAGKAHVGPANFAAKAVRFVPSLIPDVSLILGVLVRTAVDKLSESILNSQIHSSAENFGLEVAPPKWRYDLSEWNDYPGFRPVKIPALGHYKLIGDVIIIKRVDLKDGQIRFKLGVHSAFIKIIGYLGYDWSSIPGYDKLDDEEKAELEGLGKDEATPRTTTSKDWLSLDMFSNANKKLTNLKNTLKSTNSSALVDSEWKAELLDAQALGIDDLGIDNLEALEVLDFLEF